MRSSPTVMRRTAPWRGARTLFDAVAASDPGFVRFAFAGRTMASVLLAILGAWLIGRGAGGAAPAAVRHIASLMAMMVAATVAMVTASGANDNGVRAQMATVALSPFAEAVGLGIALVLAPVHVIALAVTTIVFGAGVYVRRFGPRGFVFGQLVFMGVFMGLLMGPLLTPDGAVKLCLFAAVGAAGAFAVRFVLWREHSARTLVWMKGAFMAQTRRVLRTAIVVYASGGADTVATRRLERQLLQLNAIALLVDALLTDPKAVPLSASPARIHRRLFDLELCIQDIVHLSTATAASVPAEARRAWAGRLEDIRRARPDDSLVLARAYAPEAPCVHAAASDGREPWTDAIVRLVHTAHAFSQRPAAEDGADATTPLPTVQLQAGNLPGSMFAASEAVERRAALSEHRWWRPSQSITRTAIQATLASAVAIAVGSALSGPRYYWALIAVMVAYMGTNTSDERVWKAVDRVLGTLCGIAVALVLIPLVPASPVPAVAVILLAVLGGFYLLRLHYVWMVIGITLAVSELYVELQEFSARFLLLRLEETAIGALSAMAVALFVFPLRSSQAADVASERFARALSQLVSEAGRSVSDADAKIQLRVRSRAVDEALQQLVATLAPRLRMPTGRAPVRRRITAAQAAAMYARRLAGYVQDADAEAPDPELAVSIARAADSVARWVETAIARRGAAEPAAPELDAALALIEREGRREWALTLYALSGIRRAVTQLQGTDSFGARDSDVLDIDASGTGRTAPSAG